MGFHERNKLEAGEWAKDLLAEGNFVVLDTETTGLNRDRADEPVAIAIVAPDGTVLLDTLVNPGMSIDPGAARVHGITDEMVSSAPTWGKLRASVLDAVRGKQVVIYNASYDYQILANAEAFATDEDEETVAETAHGFMCAMVRYAEFRGDWNDYHQSYKWQRLAAACAQQNIQIEAKEHSALGDCLRTLALIKCMAASVKVEVPKEAQS